MGKNKFFADECVFGSTVAMMREMGFDVIRVQELGMRGASDSIVYDKAQELEAVFITNDQGFANILKYPPSKSNGIIVLKVEPEKEKVIRVHRVLAALLKTESEFKGILYVVDKVKYRKRSKP